MTRPWETVSSTLALDGSPWMRVWVDTVRLPSGRTLHPFYRYEKMDFAAIFAITEEGRALVLRRWRYGPRAPTLDIVAGYLDEGEAPLEAAKRELLEETGRDARAWEPLGSVHTDGNSGGSVCHFFLARDARRVAEPADDDTEEAEILTMDASGLRDALERGEFKTLAGAATVARGLLHWKGAR